ncbi:Phytosulfokine receptor 1 [Spatholobus suberectus]|nr:Phytosulfokine receptor 1 [Spatholobus suberectus]
MGFHSLFLSAILILFISFGTSTHESQNLTSSPNDFEALTGFSSCLESAIPDWSSSTSPDHCTWSGVTCDALPGVGTRVVRLELGSTRLTGKICESLAGLDQLRVLNLSHNLFTGSLPGNLFHLQNLEVMDLSNNYFEGSINTAVCSSFSLLQEFKLSYNFFSGEIPGNLGNCSSLQHLSINGNDLSGSLPESIFQLQNLNELYLQDNKLSGLLSKGVGKLSNLAEFDISNNEFSGILPNIFGGLTRLKFFSAESNRFTGHLPASLVNSPSLQMLNLRNNSLGGSVNLNCSVMKNLTSIVLSHNQFHCSVLVSLMNCLRLEGIGLDYNHFNCGEIPVNLKNLQYLTQLTLTNASLHNLSATLEVLSHCRNLSTLGLPMNFHNEEMPQPQGQNLEFSNLKVFVLSHGQIKGSFPKWLSGCKMLQMLDLSWNHLSGSIPSWIGKFNNLYYLDLSNNSFTGKIPQSLTMVLSLQLGNLSLEGTLFAFPIYSNVRYQMGFHRFFLFAILIPYIRFGTSTHESQNLTSSSNDLEALIGFSSCLESAIPDWNSSTSPDYCTWSGVTCDVLPRVGARVVRLELGSTRLTGKICESFAGLDELRVLNLSYNFFTGSLPDNLFHLQNLEIMDFSNNHFEGSINTVVCSFFARLRVFKLSNNCFSGEIPGNLGNCSSLQYLFINGNDLSGSLPESIFQLQSLNELDMQDNKLSGPLSEGVGKLSNLVEFDISNNEFSGILPNIFGGLTRLKVFSAESNRFTGQLPTSLVNSPSLQVLNMIKNSLGGSINLNCSAMKNLTTLGLGSNQLRCPTPGSRLSNCLRLEAIDLAGNHFNCGIPVNLKNLQSVTQVYLTNASMHNLSTTLEVLSHCKKLSSVVLSKNFHNEEMPQLQGQNLEFSNLKVFVLANSQIKGSFPKWLSGCKMLQMLDLSWNHLTGSIPSWIGKFNNLYYLDLSNNSFTGNIPQSLTMFLSLQHKNSSLEGTLPAFPLYGLCATSCDFEIYAANATFEDSLICACGSCIYHHLVQHKCSSAPSVLILDGTCSPDFRKVQIPYMLSLLWLNNYYGQHLATLKSMLLTQPFSRVRMDQLVASAEPVVEEVIRREGALGGKAEYPRNKEIQGFVDDPYILH